MSDKPIEEMRELLARMWCSNVIQFKDEDIEAYKADKEIYKAILAVLSGPSKEERGGLLVHLKNLVWGSHHGVIELCPNCIKIRALILGHAAQEKAK